MPKAVKIILALIGFGLLLVAVFVVDQFIFPFTAKPPYFSDVEAVFNRIQIPSDWEQISSSENRGIRGKRCPIENVSVCFHKSSTYKVRAHTTVEDVKDVFITSGCESVATEIVKYSDSDRTATNLSCSVEGLNVAGTYSQEGGIYEVSIYITS